MRDSILPVVIPFKGLWEMTQEALKDIRAQEAVVPYAILVDNLSDKIIAKQASGYVLDRLSSTDFIRMPGTVCELWNTGLDLAWEQGANVAAVVNNDVRLHRLTFLKLWRCLETADAMFVSAVGVNDDSWWESGDWDAEELIGNKKAGPDYSCFLITKECHEAYRFDDAFTYMGDLDHHRRMMLGGDGARIFGVNVPYLHLASQTIKKASAKELEQFHKTNARHLEEYRKKWGGGPNEEIWNRPGNEPPQSLFGVCTTTPDLNRHGCGGRGDLCCAGAARDRRS
jgi:hypothetical protein